MQFTKKVLYLGYKPMNLKDGTVLNSITFFDPDAQDSVQVNVQATNRAVSDLLGALSLALPVMPPSPCGRLTSCTAWRWQGSRPSRLSDE